MSNETRKHIARVNEICPDCEEIAKRDGHKWQA